MFVEATHRAFNQVPDLTGSNPFMSDITLQDALKRLGGGRSAGALQAFDDQLDVPETLQRAAEASTYHLELHTHSRTGERIDVIHFAPIWHVLLGLVRSQGL